ncbi:MAG: hypothetical protein ABJF50_22935 [Paracoccaceae bacterium]|uniref:hypothetical protein n=1 Tax=Yoonia sp. TaxID=2212373 RepID=UPI003279F407
MFEHYTKLLDQNNSALQDLKDDNDSNAIFTSAHNLASDYETLKLFLVDRPEDKMFELACIEYQHALFSASIAHYRQAHVSLRLFFELSLGCVMFSAHEIDAQLWLQCRKDINWNAVSNEETGVFSKSFAGAFFDELKDACPQYRALAAQVYRECSEYVHGNRQSFRTDGDRIEYRSDDIQNWAERADTVAIAVKFAFLCRFLKGSVWTCRGLMPLL